MTRDSIPRDDLYGELEVSRQASVAAIEAAYRRLVKQHHPDVARSDDVERIKRLNLAREWLTDLDRRRRYDVSRGMSPTSAIAHHSPNGDDDASGTRWRSAPATARAAPDASADPARTFGVNANEVRIFLAGLRGLDSERARRVFDGRAVAHAKGYAAARRAAAQIGQSMRKTEWQLAREAASVIARGKLGDTTLTEQVVDVLADIAGAITIRDLLSKSDYKTLLLPWTWKSARVVPDKEAAQKARATKTPRPVTTQPAAPTVAAASVAASPVVPATAAAPSPADTPIGRGPEHEPAGLRPETQPTRRVSISDLGASPWQPGPEPAPESTTARTSSGLDGAVPAVSSSARSSLERIPSSRPVPARPGPERPTRGAAIPAVSIPSAPLPAIDPPRVRLPSWLPAAIGIVVLVVVAGAFLGIGRPPAEQRVAGITDAPTTGTSGATAVVVAGTPDAGASAAPSASDPGGETPAPGATEPPGGPGGPGGGATRPPEATPRPTKTPPTPGPTPTPTPHPTPPPTPTPEPECTVPNLIGETAKNATATWAAAGFTGPITFNPPMQPNQRIGWQSLGAGASEPCSSGITVRKVA